MSKALDDFARAFGAAVRTPGEINSTAQEVRHVAQEAEKGAKIFLVLQVAMTISSAIIAYSAYRNLQLQERRMK